MKEDIEQLNLKIEEESKFIETLKYIKLIEIINKAVMNKIRRLFILNQSEVVIPISREDVIKTVLEFYKYFNSDMYESAKNIIINRLDSDILIAIYDNLTKESLPNDELFQKYKNSPRITNIYKDISLFNMKKRIVTKKSNIYIPLKSDINDVYVLAHEIAHSFTKRNNEKEVNETELLLAEVLPNLMEMYLGDFLVKKGMITSNFNTLRNSVFFEVERRSAIANSILLELIERRRNKKVIGEEDIEKVLQNNQLKSNTEAVSYHLKHILKRENNIWYDTKYIISDLLMPYMYNLISNESGEKRDKILNDYITAIKNDDLENTLSSINLSLNEESLNKLIKCKNQQRNELQREINKLESKRGSNIEREQ